MIEPPTEAEIFDDIMKWYVPRQKGKTMQIIMTKHFKRMKSHPLREINQLIQSKQYRSMINAGYRMKFHRTWIVRIFKFLIYEMICLYPFRVYAYIEQADGHGIEEIDAKAFPNGLSFSRWRAEQAWRDYMVMKIYRVSRRKYEAFPEVLDAKADQAMIDEGMGP